MDVGPGPGGEVHVIALWLALVLPAEAARGIAGLEWRPLSRQDLVFVEENRTSGTAVGAQDGTVRPNLAAFGGAWLSRHVGLVGGLGVAAISTGSRAEDTARRQWTAVLRPSLDLRIGWIEPRVRFPIPWILVGAHGDIPVAGDRSNGFTEEEQDAADIAAAERSRRLGGAGGRVGLGVDFRVVEGLAFGAQVALGLTGTTFASDEQAFSTLWVVTEASLLLTFEWPDPGRRTSRQGTRGGDEPRRDATSDDP